MIWYFKFDAKIKCFLFSLFSITRIKKKKFKMLYYAILKQTHRDRCCTVWEMGSSVESISLSTFPSDYRVTLFFHDSYFYHSWHIERDIAIIFYLSFSFFTNNLHFLLSVYYENWLIILKCLWLCFLKFNIHIRFIIKV